MYRICAMIFKILDKLHSIVNIKRQLRTLFFVGSLLFLGFNGYGQDPVVTLAPTDLAAAETGLVTGAITVNFDVPSASEITVNLNLSGGASTNLGTDYNLSGTDVNWTGGTAMTVVFPVGITSRTITLTPVDDALDEEDETVIVTTADGVGYTHGGTSETVTITDNDPTPTVAFSVTSSNQAESIGSANLEVALSAISGRNVTVDYTVSGTASGTGVDYTLANGTLTIPAGSPNANITISGIVDDLLDEDNETVIVTITNPSNATLGGSTIHAYTINDNDSLPSIAFSVANSNGAESTASVNLQVALSTLSGREVTVNYAVTGGTATNGGVDYTTLANGTLTIPAGTLTGNITITGIVDDNVFEQPDETIEVTLSVPTNAELGTNSVHTYTINNNDSVISMGGPQSAAEGNSGLTPFIFTVNRTGSTAGVESATYTVTGSGTDPANAADFQGGVFPTGPVNFGAGDTAATITINVNGDTTLEATETFTVTLTNPNPSSSTTLGTATAIGTINNDDGAATVFSG